MYIYIRIWATVNIWYIAPSHQFFEECIIVFQVLVYKQMLLFFEECIKPQLNFQKIKMSRILLSIS